MYYVDWTFIGDEDWITEEPFTTSHRFLWLAKLWVWVGDGIEHLNRGYWTLKVREQETS